MRVIRETVIPAGGNLALEVRRGQILRVIDLKGQQVIDFVSFNAQDFSEKLSCVYSNVMNGTWRLTRGHVIYSTRAREMWSIVEDTVGVHYSGGGY